MKLFSLLIWIFLLLFCAPSVFAISIEISNLVPINDYYSLDAVITGAATDSSYFVQAIFKKENSSNYSGFTWSEKGEWLKYDGSPEKEYIKENFPILAPDQVRKLLIKPDPEKGSGNFTLRLRRYTGGSTSHTGDPSNELSLVVVQNQSAEPTSPTIATPSTTPTSTPTSSPSPTPTPSPTLRATATPTANPTQPKKPTTSLTPTPSVSTRETITPKAPIPATASATIPPKVEIFTESTLSASIQTPSLSQEIKGASTGSSIINKLVIILGLCLAVPASALYFLSDRVKIHK